MMSVKSHGAGCCLGLVMHMHMYKPASAEARQMTAARESCQKRAQFLIQLASVGFCRVDRAVVVHCVTRTVQFD